MQSSVRNEGSACRDFCMLERNVLSHLKLGLLLALLSFSLLLHTTLVGDDESAPSDQTTPQTRLAIAVVQVVAAAAAIAAGLWEYYSGCHDLFAMKAFLVNERSHFTIITTISAVVLITCVVLLSDSNLA